MRRVFFGGVLSGVALTAALLSGLDGFWGWWLFVFFVGAGVSMAFVKTK